MFVVALKAITLTSFLINKLIKFPPKQWEVRETQIKMHIKKINLCYVIGHKEKKEKEQVLLHAFLLVLIVSNKYFAMQS